jgi:hypothetical protein
MTVPSDEAVGAYSITGDYKDTDHPTPGVTTTGDTQVTVELGDLHINEGDDFQTIIETAPEGSTIYWHAGTYASPTTTRLSVRLQDGIHLIGDGADLVVLENISLEEFSFDSISIHTGGNNVTIEGLSFTGDYGTIDLPFPDHVTINDCVLDGSQLMLTDSAVVENCTSSVRFYILPAGSPGTGIGGGIIRNNVFENPDSGALQIQGDHDMLVEGNTIQNMTTYGLNIDISTNVVVRDNTFENCELDVISITDAYNIEVSGNTFKDISSSEGIIYVWGDAVIKENTFENCAADLGVFYLSEGVASVYMNNFINSPVSVYDEAEWGPNSITWESPSAMSYTYQGSSYSSVLGNYFANYSGNDTDNNGIGDTPFIVPVVSDIVDTTSTIENDSYPLMGAWEDGNIAGAGIIYQGTVKLGSDMTCTFVPYNDASAEYDIAPLSAMAALMATGLDLEINDEDYPEYNSFYLDNIEDIEAPTETCYWAFYVNGVSTDYGIGHVVNDTLVDGDVVRFSYTDYMTDEQFFAVEITVDDTGRDDFLYYGSVDLVNGETYKLIPYNTPENEYDIDSMSALGALIETGLDTMVSDAWYNAGLGSFFLDAIEGTDTPEDFSTSWDFRVNGVSTTYGVGNVENDTVSDGDLVSFVYWAYSPETEGDAVHIHVNEISNPVIAQRDIANQNFYQDLLTMGQTSTQVTVTLTAREEVDSLAFEEVIPANWTLTPSNNDYAIFKANLTDDTRFEWVWADVTMNAGDSKTVAYTLTLSEDATAQDYYLAGTSSVFVNGEDVNDIPVVGEELVKVSLSDWNPWNDLDSEGGDLITTAELQSAVNCWLNDLPTPITGEDVTTDRLQMLVFYWINDLSCTESADA